MDPAATVSFYMCADIVEINKSWGPEVRSTESMAFMLTASTVFTIRSKHQTSTLCVLLLWSSAAILWLKATSQHLTLQHFVKPTLHFSLKPLSARNYGLAWDSLFFCRRCMLFLSPNPMRHESWVLFPGCEHIHSEYSWFLIYQLHLCHVINRNCITRGK